MTQAMQQIVDLKMHIYKFWGVSDPDNHDMVDFEVFGAGRAFLEYGTLELKKAFDFYKTGLIEIKPLRIEPFWDEFLVMDLSPEFKIACMEYILAEGFPNAVGRDYYEEENEVEDFDDFDEDDFRGSHVFLMSEVKLKKELKTRERAWLMYRTPYRPEV
mgnify:CR=1 FL=1